MVSCAVQSLLHLVFLLGYEDNRITIVNNYVQIITFSFIAQGFAHLYYRLKFDNERNLLPSYEQSALPSILEFTYQSVYWSTWRCLAVSSTSPSTRLASSATCKT
jgi:uncharacterized membrane protein